MFYGGLVEGLSREEFFSGVSMPRNRELMRIFKDLDLVEHIGSGMGKIMTVYNKNNFEFMEHFLRIKIPFEKGYENDYTELNEKSSVKSSVKIVKLMQDNPKITIPEIVEIIGISKRAIEKQISQLKKENKVKRVGGRKEGYWEVIK